MKTGPGYVLGLDIGTSAVRAILHDLRGRPVRSVRLLYQTHVRADGAAEVDADSLVNLVGRSITDLLQLAGRSQAARIIGVGTSVFWHGLVATDDSANALTPVYLWADTQSSTFSERLANRLNAEEIRLRTGCPIHPSYWPAKIAWLHAERPDLWKRPVRWLSFGDLLFWRLFGRLATSVSMASATGLFRLSDCSWDDDLISHLHISPQSLPPAGEIEQNLVPRYGRRWPVLASVPWLLAIGDGALANLGSGCITPARRAVSIGTSAAVRVIHSSTDRSLPVGLWRYRLDRRRFVTGGALSNGGNLREWLLATLRVVDGKIETNLRWMVPGAHGLTFMPHLAGERSLGYAPRAFGAIAGLTLATKPEDIARAGLEAVAVELARVNRRMDEVMPQAKLLVASGTGLLHSSAWLQMVADATGHTIAPSRTKEASARGAAIFAMERLGLERAARLDPGTGMKLKRRPSHASVYRQIEARQEALYRALVGDRILEINHSR